VKVFNVTTAVKRMAHDLASLGDLPNPTTVFASGLTVKPASSAMEAVGIVPLSSSLFDNPMEKTVSICDETSLRAFRITGKA
jgi:hypothetical protein